MSLTISELEAERAKILEEIESKAKNLSDPSAADSSQPATLNDWLNAAEEVMPSQSDTNRKTKPRKTTASYTDKALHSSRPNNRMSFFGVVILLSLLLTILGVLYIAYNSIHKELQSVLQLKDDNIAQMQALQDEMKSLQEVVAAGGKSELFVSLETKVTALENEVASLKAQLAEQAKAPVSKALTQQTSSADAEDTSNSVIKGDTVVTEAILDEKLKNYTQQLEAKIDAKLEKILSFLSGGSAIFGDDKPALNSNDAPIEGKADSAAETSKVENPTIETPEVDEVKTPTISTPLVKMVEEVKNPKTPESPQAPVANATADVQWLLDQPKAHYVLQLASMPDMNSLKKIIETKELSDTKILPQTRNDLTNYILVTGSFASREDANNLAKKIKAQSGISPWIRKAGDLTGRL